VALLQSVVERNQLDHNSLYKLAELIYEDNSLNVENVEIERADPRQLFEKALQQNRVSVPLWESYIKFSMAHSDDLTNSVFERAIQAVGQLTRATNIWLMWIDFEMSFLNMAKCSLLCYLALKTPLLEIDLVLNKYMEVLTNFYEMVVEDHKKTDDSVRKQICESHTNDYNALAKLTLSKT